RGEPRVDRGRGAERQESVSSQLHRRYGSLMCSWRDAPPASVPDGDRRSVVPWPCGRTQALHEACAPKRKPEVRIRSPTRRSTMLRSILRSTALFTWLAFPAAAQLSLVANLPGTFIDISPTGTPLSL